MHPFNDSAMTNVQRNLKSSWILKSWEMLPMILIKFENNYSMREEGMQLTW